MRQRVTDDQGEEQRETQWWRKGQKKWNKQERWLNWQSELSCLYYFSIELFGRNKGRVCLQCVWVLGAQGYQEPACLCVCVCVVSAYQRHTLTGTRCSLLADGFFSLEPKAQPSANIREAQGQLEWIGHTHHAHLHTHLSIYQVQLSIYQMKEEERQSVVCKKIIDSWENVQLFPYRVVEQLKFNFDLMQIHPIVKSVSF